LEKPLSLAEFLDAVARYGGLQACGNLKAKT
jgi:hypothetical protein